MKSSAIKVHAENAWNTRGASQFVPYLSHKDDKTLSAERRVWWNDREDNVNEPLTWGSYGVQPYRIFDLVQRASMHGIDVVTHVDGARLSKRLTEIYIEALQNHPDARNRIDHFGMMTDETREKVIRYGIPTNATPVFYNEVDAGIGGKDLYAFLPKDYIHEVYGQYSELAQRYDRLSLSGDTPGVPVERAYPVFLMQQAMTLVEPTIKGSKPFPPWRPKMTLDQVLHAYTVAPAWQLRMENKIGSLEVGKCADMAIFAKSLRKIAPEHLIEQAKVVGTLLNGKFTYRDGM